MSQQQTIDWSKESDAPISGRTRTSRHASASGAMAAVVIRGRVVKAILAAFRSHGVLTIAETSALTGIKEGTICSTWDRLKRIGWIEETGGFFHYVCHGRTVKRAGHQLTQRGREIAREAAEASR